MASESQYSKFSSSSRYRFMELVRSQINRRKNEFRLQDNVQNHDDIVCPGELKTGYNVGKSHVPRLAELMTLHLERRKNDALLSPSFVNEQKQEEDLKDQLNFKISGQKMLPKGNVFNKGQTAKCSRCNRDIERYNSFYPVDRYRVSSKRDDLKEDTFKSPQLQVVTGPFPTFKHAKGGPEMIQATTREYVPAKYQDPTYEFDEKSRKFQKINVQFKAIHISPSQEDQTCFSVVETSSTETENELEKEKHPLMKNPGVSVKKKAMTTKDEKSKMQGKGVCSKSTDTAKVYEFPDGSYWSYSSSVVAHSNSDVSVVDTSDYKSADTKKEQQTSSKMPDESTSYCNDEGNEIPFNADGFIDWLAFLIECSERDKKQLHGDTEQDSESKTLDEETIHETNIRKASDILRIISRLQFMKHPEIDRPQHDGINRVDVKEPFVDELGGGESPEASARMSLPKKLWVLSGNKCIWSWLTAAVGGYLITRSEHMQQIMRVSEELVQHFLQSGQLTHYGPPII